MPERRLCDSVLNVRLELTSAMCIQCLPRRSWVYSRRVSEMHFLNVCLTTTSANVDEFKPTSTLQLYNVGAECTTVTYTI